MPSILAVHFPQTIAFHVTRSGNRFNGCYMDGGRAVFEGSAVKDNIWTNGFECCQGASAAPGTTASGITLVGNSIGPGLQIMNNEFGGGSIYHCSTFDPVSGFCDDQPPAGRAHASKSCSAILNITVAGRECRFPRVLHPLALTVRLASVCDLFPSS